MTKKILIVGSQGYIGSALSAHLIREGYSVVGVDIGLFRYGVIRYPQEYKTLDKPAQSIRENDLEKFDAVIQLAGISNDPFCNFDPAHIYDPTHEYTINIAKMCKKVGIRFIFPSSCSIYGFGEKNLSEDAKPDPKTPYSQNKVDIEKDLSNLADQNFSPIALRLATVFGFSPRIRFDLVINMLTAMAYTEKRVILNSNGLAWRPHVHIDDVCTAFHKCVELDYEKPELLTLNVGRDDNNWRIIDVAEYVCSQVPNCELKFASEIADANELIKDRKIQDGVDVRNYKVSFEKIHSLIPGYKCKIDVKTGIDLLLEDFRAARLTADKFHQRDFYRLQQIEYLIQTGHDQILDFIYSG